MDIRIDPVVGVLWLLAAVFFFLATAALGVQVGLDRGCQSACYPAQKHSADDDQCLCVTEVKDQYKVAWSVTRTKQAQSNEVPHD